MGKDIEKRLNITISFKKGEEAYYNHAKNQPNSSFYIKALIKEDIKNSKKKMNTEDIFGGSEVIENMLNW